ncbi:MAG: protein-L-isoaspartate(D-aspartate) O-methyltransferase [Proteobacteria bacterium]|nr:protein-L-isoaspartate(D-aspartate) O-methyltransferase [Pseudomonadota bacterium]
MVFLQHDKQNKKWHTERLLMVEHQLKARGISNNKVLNAMAKIPREVFIPAEYRDSAYKDGPLPIGEGQTISQPYMVAIMTQCLQLKGPVKVLEIGTGSGYQMAILLEITPHVYSIERLPAIVQKARENLALAGFEHPSIRVGDGSCGWPEEAPFDGIIVTSGAPRIPSSLKEQLSDGGRLVIPVGSRYSQVLYTVTRQGNGFLEEEITACVFVPLIGKYGWKEEQ